MRALLSSGADANARAQYGDTPLINASQNGHTETVRVLISGGDDANAKKVFVVQKRYSLQH